MLPPQTTSKNRTVLVCLGCYNGISDWGLKQHEFISQSSRGWEVRDQRASSGLELQYMNLQGSHSVHSKKE